MTIQALSERYQTVFPPLTRVFIGGALGTIAGAVVAESFGLNQTVLEKAGFVALGLGMGTGMALYKEREFRGEPSATVGLRASQLTMETALKIFGGMTVGAGLTEFMGITRSSLGIGPVFPESFATASGLVIAGLAGFTQIVDPFGLSSVIARSIYPYHGMMLGSALKILGGQSAKEIVAEGLSGCGIAISSSLALVMETSGGAWDQIPGRIIARATDFFNANLIRFFPSQDPVG